MSIVLKEKASIAIPASGKSAFYLNANGIARIKGADGIDREVSPLVNLRDRPYGAIGNGVADDTAAVQAWASVTGCKYAPKGRYKVSTQINGSSGRVYGDGIGQTIFDFSGATTTVNSCFQFAGSEPVALPAFTAISAGDTTITFASAPAVAAGDVLYILNSADGSWSGFRPDYRAGEFCVVESVASNIVTVVSPLVDSYAGTTTISVLSSPCCATVENLEVIGNETHTSSLIAFDFAVASGLQSVKLTKGKFRNLYVKRCFDFKVNNITTILSSANNGTNYAISLAGTQEVVITGIYARATRHAVAIGGSWVLNRYINVSGSVLKSEESQAADFHGNAEFCTYDGCIIEGAIVAGNHVAIKNNKIQGSHAYITLRELKGLDIDISNNDFVTDRYWFSAVDTSKAAVIMTNSGIGANTVLGGVLSIKNNKIKYTPRSGDEGRRIILIANNGCLATNRNIDIVGNEITTTVKNAAEFGIYIDGSTEGFDSVRLSGASYGVSVRIRATSNVDIFDLSLRGPSYAGLDIVGLGTTIPYNFLRIANTRISDKDRAGIVVTADSANKWKRITISDCVSAGNNLVDTGDLSLNSAWYITQVEDLHVSDNVIGGTGTFRRATFTNITTIHESNNTYYGSGSISKTTVGKHIQAGAAESIAATPLFIGQAAVAAGVGYIAVGTSSAADWKQVTA